MSILDELKRFIVQECRLVFEPSILDVKVAYGHPFLERKTLNQRMNKNNKNSGVCQ